jgi:hypothetical protein
MANLGKILLPLFNNINYKLYMDHFIIKSSLFQFNMGMAIRRNHTARYKWSGRRIQPEKLVAITQNPVLNIPRRHKDVATDTVYSRIPAVDDGSTAAQFFRTEIAI